MATYSGNSVYLTFNGVVVTALWREFTPSLKIGDEDVSVGGSINWEAHAGKLMVINAKMQLVYDDSGEAARLGTLWTTNAVVAVVYGPEGNTVGKPQLAANFKLNGIDGPGPKYEKTLVTFDYDLISTGTPTKNLWAGDTF